MKLRFPVSMPVLCGNEKKYVLEALDSGWISSNGAFIARFESEVAKLVEVEECLAVCNGTAALHLACLAMGLKAGDEVLVPTLTYVASANAIAYCGAVPVFVDCDAATWNVTTEAFRSAWTDKTVGIIAVHLYGLPCRSDQLVELCREKGGWLIEDCAESLGATIDDRPTGSFGDAATFSFYGNKTISTGEGGMLHVKDPEKRKLARMLRGQGMDLDRRYWHPLLGYNYRMTNVQAAIGLGQIEMVRFHLGERRRIAKRYKVNLQTLANKGLVALPVDVPGLHSTSWLFSLVLQSEGEGKRDQLMAQLASRDGIETRPFFVPMHYLPMYQGPYPFPVTERLSRGGINLPTYTGLNDADIDYICECLTERILEL